MPAYILQCECGWTDEVPGIAHVREAIDWHGKAGCEKTNQGKKVYVTVKRKDEVDGQITADPYGINMRCGDEACGCQTVPGNHTQ
jgi:hypothetical protein